MSSKLQLRFFLSWMVSVYMLAASTTSQAAEMSLAQSPLFLGTQIPPNVFFMLDDSGSMDWETLTVKYQYYTNYWSDGGVSVVDDGTFLGYASSGKCTGRDLYYYIFEDSTNNDNVYNSGFCQLEGSPQVAERDWRIRNSDLNIMYYNPAATYQPWYGFTDANFSSARSNPQPGSDGYSELNNLDGFQYEVWIDNLGYDDDGDGPDGRVRGPTSVVDGANGIVDLWDSRVSYTVTNSGVDLEYILTTEAGVDGGGNCNLSDSQAKTCFGTAPSGATTLNGSDEDAYGRTLAEIQQNVANCINTIAVAPSS